MDYQAYVEKAYSVTIIRSVIKCVLKQQDMDQSNYLKNIGQHSFVICFHQDFSVRQIVDCTQQLIGDSEYLHVTHVTHSKTPEEQHKAWIHKDISRDFLNHIRKDWTHFESINDFSIDHNNDTYFVLTVEGECYLVAEKHHELFDQLKQKEFERKDADTRELKYEEIKQCFKPCIGKLFKPEVLNKNVTIKSADISTKIKRKKTVSEYISESVNTVKSKAYKQNKNQDGKKYVKAVEPSFFAVYNATIHGVRPGTEVNNDVKHVENYFKTNSSTRRSIKVLPRKTFENPQPKLQTSTVKRRIKGIRNKSINYRSSWHPYGQENIGSRCRNVKVYREYEDLNIDDGSYLDNAKIVSLLKLDGTTIAYSPELLRLHLREITNLPSKEPFILQEYTVLPVNKSKYNKPATRRNRTRGNRRDQTESTSQDPVESFPTQVSEDGNRAPTSLDNLQTSGTSIFAGTNRLPSFTTNLSTSIESDNLLTSRRQGQAQTGTAGATGSHVRPPRHPEYRDRNRRQMSFTNWPGTTRQDPTRMVDYGFFFTGRFDLVRCYQCGIGLKDWSEPDEPLFEHVKHSSECPFLVDLLGPELLAAYKVNLIPAGATPAANTDRQNQAQGQENVGLENPAQAPVTRIRSPEYEDIEARVRSYTGSWPSTIIQTPRALAEAGFYYTGHNDVCRCFYCDGGLQRWDPQDDPWIEHTRWFPNCPHVRNVKGSEYVNLVQQALAASSEDDDPAVVLPGQRGGTITGAMGNLSIAQGDPLSTPAAQSLQNIGYSRQAILLAVHECLAKGKQDYTSTDLMTILMDKEDNGEALPTDSPAEEELSFGAVGGIPLVDPEDENKRLKGILKCLNCEERDTNILFLPCTHHKLCEECAEEATICPICGRKIAEKIRTYMS